MCLHDLIENRYSVRSYKSDAVPAETVERVINAARMAPSWANKQCWSFVVVEGHVQKKLIGKASGQGNIEKACDAAPLVIVLCANPKESGVKNGMEYYLFDCGLAMQNLVLAAAEEGLGTCIVGWFDEKAVKGALGIPEHWKVVAFTPLGYPSGKAPNRSRKAMEEITFLNNWGKAYK